MSSLSAARIAARIGLINTMVFTHIPSNVLLILVPLMPNLPLAIAVLLLRFSLSQMDVPTRQSYVMSVVDPDERSAAAGVTGIARTTGAAISPSISSVLVSSAGYASLPFYLAGGLKIVYDLLLYRRVPDGAAAERGSAGRRLVRGARSRAAGRASPGATRRRATTSTTTPTAMSRSNGWRTRRISVQFSPRTVPA